MSHEPVYVNKYMYPFYVFVDMFGPRSSGKKSLVWF